VILLTADVFMIEDTTVKSETHKGQKAANDALHRALAGSQLVDWEFLASLLT
jgi:hypothetical protein